MNRSEFQLRHWSSAVLWLSAGAVGREDEVACDDRTDRKAWTDGERRLDLRLRPTISWPVWLRLWAAAAAKRLDKPVLFSGRTELGSDPKNGGERRRPSQSQPVMVDFVFQAGEAGGVGAWLTLQHDGAPVGENELVPDKEHARLAEGDLGVIDADKFRPLRDQEKKPRRTVIDIFGHLGGDLAGKIGANAGDERRGDDGTRLQDIARRRSR